MPDLLPFGDVDTIEIIRYARHHCDLLRTVRSFNSAYHHRVEKVVHLAGDAIEMDLPKQLQVLHVRSIEGLLVSDPPVPTEIRTFHQPIRRSRHTTQRSAQQNHPENNLSHPPSPSTPPGDALVSAHMTITGCRTLVFQMEQNSQKGSKP